MGKQLKLRLEDDYRLNQMTHGIAFKGTNTYRVHGLQAQGTIANLKGVQSFAIAMLNMIVSLTKPHGSRNNV
jgi:hypothetical protein